MGLMADISTTVSVTKELNVYGRCVSNGNLTSHFLKILKLEDSKADTIVSALTAYIHSLQLSFLSS